jgi:hypothetical protein
MAAFRTDLRVDRSKEEAEKQQTGTHKKREEKVYPDVRIAVESLKNPQIWQKLTSPGLASGPSLKSSFGRIADPCVVM